MKSRFENFDFLRDCHKMTDAKNSSLPGFWVQRFRVLGSEVQRFWVQRFRVQGSEVEGFSVKAEKLKGKKQATYSIILSF